MNKILTIVVPSYNAESYLVETIPTMVNASNIEDVEVLIVNDGSKDNTLKIARQFEEKYPTVVKVIDKENGGHGSTINAGIKVATGKYFKVIDADDWVDTPALEKLINYLKTVDVDEVISPYNEVYVDVNKTQVVSLNHVSEKVEYQYSDFLQQHGELPQMHMVTIKTSILRDNDITIGEKMFYVDMEYIIFPTPYIKSVTYLNEVVYQYRLGTLTQSVSVNSFIKNRHMHENVIQRIIAYLNTVKLDDNVKNIVQKRVMLMIDRQAKVLLAMDDVKTAKQEFVTFEKKLLTLNTYYAKHSISRVVNLLRLTNYVAFRGLSLVVRTRNHYLSKKKD